MTPTSGSVTVYIPAKVPLSVKGLAGVPLPLTVTGKSVVLPEGAMGPVTVGGTSIPHCMPAAPGCDTVAVTMPPAVIVVALSVRVTEFVAVIGSTKGGAGGLPLQPPTRAASAIKEYQSLRSILHLQVRSLYIAVSHGSGGFMVTKNVVKQKRDFSMRFLAEGYYA
jgi:hypothetical protein